MKYLIPFLSRGISAVSQDNLLCRHENVFIMDNHRLALWCWFQKMQPRKRYNLFHIDAHPDLSESALAQFDKNMWNLSLEDYRDLWQEDINTPLIRWDNYIEIFLKKYPDNVGLTISATHHLGSHKELSEQVNPYQLAKRCRQIFTGKTYANEFSWIVNLDLDYFYSAAPEKMQLLSDEMIQDIKESIQIGLNEGIIDVLTISLSPECCGSWEKAEAMLAKFGFSISINKEL